MKKFYQILGICALMAGANTAWAIDPPKTNAGAPKDGVKMVLVNAYNPTGYMSRTSWDGALYFDGTSIKAENAFTAQRNEDNTWSFVYPQSDATVRYLGMYPGSGNLNAKDGDTPLKWTVEAGSIEGYYGLRAGEGNSDASQGLLLHLNAGGQYFVISEPVNGGGWYPDYAGGAVPATGDSEYEYEVDENGRALMADHASENWQFLPLDDYLNYYSAWSAYAAIKNLEENYLDMDEYSAGFQATYDAVVAIYTSKDFNADGDPQLIGEMISKKIAFYQAIVDAENLDYDATLGLAITNAKESFTTITSVEELEAAIATLNKAVVAFQEGTGDLTAMGKNMSFEDLTSQNGEQTSSVAAPPVGWNVYINGVQVTTADEVRAQGVSAWHGINNDCDGDVKDGNYGFGLWTSGVPDYEISQTLEGLENGTYEITAGLMVGANGNGSRRTTQRIFGNLNVTYFASEGEYDTEKLTMKEVPAYQGNYELTTDRTLQLMNVRAYVYDGTLTFGLRTDGDYKAALRETSNGAGGDGWFKIDNFRIQKLGYVGEDAANVANHYLGVYSDIQNANMEASLKKEIRAITQTYSSVSASTPADEINNIIKTLTTRLDDVIACVNAYQRLREAIDEAYEKAQEYQFYSGYDDFINLIDEADEAEVEGTLDVAGVENMLKQLQEAETACAASGIAVGDYISIIKNPSFEDLSAQGGNSSDGVQNAPNGWDLFVDGVKVERAPISGWCAINRGDNINDSDENGTEWTTQYTDGEFLWGMWTANVPSVQLSQSFTGIPAGTYTLSCDMVVQYNWGGHCVTTQRIFANEFIQMYGAEETYAAGLNDTEDMILAKQLDANIPADGLRHMNYAGWLNESSYGTTSCPHAMSLTFGVDNSGELTIGFRTNNVDPFTGEAHPYDSAGWFKLDNFKLFYNSTDIPTAIQGIQNAPTELTGRQYFTADGRQISQPANGITIVKNIMSDGSVKVTKIMK